MLVGTWNLENLFRPGGEFGPHNDADYRAKLAALAATVNAAAPDVLGVQEVGSPEALADLVALLDGDWHTLLSERFAEDHPIRVGVLSRHPIATEADVATFSAELPPLRADDDPTVVTTGMGRGVLAVTVTAPSAPLTVVVCHLKSKLLSYPTASGKTRFQPHDEGERARYAAYALYRRAAEAVTVRGLADRLVDGAGQTRRVVVLGDLNDEPQAATTQILLGPPGSEIGTPGRDRPDKGDAWRLWSLAPLIPEAQRYSRVYRGRHELIDHIMVSRALLDQVGEVRALNDRPLVSIADDPSARRNAHDSDHAPVVAQLNL